MRRPRLAISAVLLAAFALLGASCAGGAGELGGPSLGGTTALKVGDVEYSNADLEAEIDQWASNPLFLQSGTGITDTGRPGARSMAITGFVVGWRASSEQARQLAAEQGYEPSAADLEQTRAGVATVADPSTGGPLFEAFDAEFQERFVEDFTLQQWAASAVGPDTELPAVAVHSRYGTYDATTGFVPPVGPRPAVGVDFGS